MWKEFVADFLFSTTGMAMHAAPQFSSILLSPPYKFRRGTSPFFLWFGDTGHSLLAATFFNLRQDHIFPPRFRAPPPIQMPCTFLPVSTRRSLFPISGTIPPFLRLCIRVCPFLSSVLGSLTLSSDVPPYTFRKDCPQQRRCIFKQAATFFFFSAA